MDALHIKLEEAFNEMIKLEANYKKQGDLRRNKKSILKRLQKLEEIHHTLASIHENTQEFTVTHAAHPYWTDRTSVMALYTRFKTTMEEKLKTLPGSSAMSLSEAILSQATTADQQQSDSGSSSDDDDDDDNDKKIQTKLNESSKEIVSKQRYKQQDFKMRALYKLIRDVEAILLLGKPNKPSLKVKIERMDTKFKEIEDTHEQILIHAVNKEQSLPYFNKNYFDTICDAYEQCRGEYEEWLEKTPSSPVTKELSLRSIEIPHFYGDALKWSVFKDIFVNLVHNNNQLNSTLKINHLKTSVFGVAAKIIAHLEPIGSNYEAAWDILMSRYENKRLLITLHVNAIINLHTINTENANAIGSLYDNLNEHLHALKNLGVDTTTWNAILIPIITKKLDHETIRLYETSLINPKELQGLDEFMKFLERRFQSLSAFQHSKPERYSSNKPAERDLNNHNKKVFVTSSKYCILCSSQHSIASCQKFQQKSASERCQLATLHELCRNCLSAGHETTDCQSRGGCETCKGNHHELLHLPTKSALNCKKEAASEVIVLGTALVRASSAQGRNEFLRVLVDPGSQATFITEDAVQRLRLPHIKQHISISGIGDAEEQVKKSTKLTITPRFPSNFKLNITALVLQKITKEHPEKQFTTEKFKHILNKMWADPTFNEPGPIDMLIGADYFTDIIQEGVIKGDSNQPMAQQSKLGWVISGRTTLQNKPTRIHTLISSVDLNKQLSQFWDIEEVHQERQQTTEEAECETIFKNTHKRLPCGRYEVSIPFKNKPVSLGDSRGTALARFLQVEKRLQKDPILKQQYVNFMEEYKNLGHMSQVKNPKELLFNDQSYYLPHHPVIKESSTTTKLRVVFDASAQTTNGESLNSQMLNGPKLQDDLVNILLRWRLRKIAVTADVEKMFRQILIAKNDQDFQLILWRTSPDKPIKTYKLQTVTYGTTSATYLSTKVLQQLAIDQVQQYPEASAIALKDFYLDDLLTGCDTKEEAIKLQQNMCQLMKNAGFNLRKWSSNCKELLDGIAQEDKELGMHTIEFDETIKALGIVWNQTKDEIQFKITTSDCKKPTKRNILSEASKLFDPLGWLAPVLIQAKILLQDLWSIGVDWDDKLDDEIVQRWEDYKNNLKHLEQLKIPRWMQYKNNNNEIELHGFCDASEKAYAAAIYSRTYNENHEPIITLIAAKTRVTPIKNKPTLPRLELCAASLLTELYKQVQESLQLKTIFFAWSDSQITLAWIKGDPTKMKIFVANRVIEILKITTSDQWRYVNTTQNPADCATRGLSPENLKDYKLWWEGPDWLKNCMFEWPNLEFELQSTAEVLNEMKAHLAKINTNASTNISVNLISTTELEIIEESSLRELIRRTAYCQRFINNLKNKIADQPINKNNFLLAAELIQARTYWIKRIQNDHFKEEFKTIKNNPSKSRLKNLYPFIDKDGLLRVGGRLQNSWLSADAKHPIILPTESHLTKLIINDAHTRTLHGGEQVMNAILRSKYWILRSRDMLRDLAYNCVTCAKNKAQKAEQLMGMLPAARVRPSRPFANTAVDYAGPFNVRTTKGRGHKSYKGFLAIFVCLATKAIHIEVVSDLTSATFIAALKRFISRRGFCSNIYSDNGTNFVGANKELKNEFNTALAESTKIAAECLANDGITWHFIPPSAPNFGGLWEAAVKSVKYHLKRTIGESTLTFEELTTVTSQIEAVLNSRPLVRISSNVDEEEILTPGHFLIGTAIIAPPMQNVTEDQSHFKNWKLTQRMFQDFWKSWSNDYLHSLQTRTKWSKEHKNLEIGNIVLIKEDNLPPAKWLLGKIVKTIPGLDGLVRTVIVKTKSSELKRPISKICPLPIATNETEAAAEDTTTTTALISRNIPYESSVLKRSISAIEEQKTMTTTINTNKRQKMSKEEDVKPITAETAPRSVRIPIRNFLRGTLDDKIKDKANSLQTSKIKRRKIIRPCSYVSAYLTTALLLSKGIQAFSNFQITPFNSQPGILFDDAGQVNIKEGEWTMIVYYNLTNYWLEFQGYQNITNQLQDICKKPFIDGNICHNILPLLSDSWNQIQHNNQLLQISPRNRRRRGSLNVVGSAANSWFGILDDEFAQQYEKQIKMLNNNEDHLQTLIKNQTTIIDSTINVIKHSNEHVQNQFKQVESVLNILNNKFTADIDAVKFNQRFIVTALQTTIMMLRYQTIQKSLLKLLFESQHGLFNSIILTNEQFDTEIRRIQRNLPLQLMIPVAQNNHNNILGMYKLASTKAKLLEKLIIMEVKIPLISKDSYQLYKLLPVPTLYGKYFLFIQPSTEYLLWNAKYDFYYSMTDKERTDCQTHETNQLICHIQAPIATSNSNSSRCEIDILRHKTKLSKECQIRKMIPAMTWIRTNYPNRWIFSTDEKHAVDLICENTKETIYLENNGLFEFKGRCQLKDSGLMIQAYNIFNSSLTASLTPKFNISLEILQINAVPTGSIHILSNNIITKEITQLQHSITQQKQNENAKLLTSVPTSRSTTTTDISYHDIHHYSATYILFMTILGFMIYRCCKKRMVQMAETAV